MRTPVRPTRNSRRTMPYGIVGVAAVLQIVDRVDDGLVPVAEPGG